MIQKKLYNDEMAKVKSKHADEVLQLRNDCRDAADKATRYSEQLQKLSKQIHNLNTENLELKKENQYMVGKLKFTEMNSGMMSSRPSLGGSLCRLPATTTQNQMIGSNLRMEDEDGELFNNTYLSDMKRGAGFEVDPYSMDELKQRNSILPPHLRDSYVIRTVDKHYSEEDMKVSYFLRISRQFSKYFKF